MRADDFVVLEREEVQRSTPAILEAHGIAEDRSKDVKDHAVLPRQAFGVLAGTSAPSAAAVAVVATQATAGP